MGHQGPVVSRQPVIQQPRHRGSVVWDCFTFFNELDVLEWRLHELEDVVDWFVLVEATRSFHGDLKPLYYQLNAARYSRWADRIRHVVVEDMPSQPTDDPHRMYEVEGIQRDAMVRGMPDLRVKDVVLVSDLDEIPRADLVAKYSPRVSGSGTGLTFRQRLFYYALDVEFPHDPWRGTRILDALQFYRLGGMQARIAGYRDVPEPLYHGWHFSFFGGEEVMVEKVRNWSHASAFIPEPLDPVGYMRDARRDARDWDPARRAQLRRVQVDDTFPRWVVENLGSLGAHLSGGHSGGTSHETHGDGRQAQSAGYR